jgi:hemin uptake protein HemP
MNTGHDPNNPASGSENARTTSATARHVSITNNRLDSRDLFVGTREITILHGGDAYHLRLTAQNKLILTK